MQAVSRIASDVDVCVVQWIQLSIISTRVCYDIMLFGNVRNISTVQQEQNMSQDAALWNTSRDYEHSRLLAVEADSLRIWFLTND